MYPIMLQLAGKKIVVIGGGKIALRKSIELIKAQGQVTVISPAFLPEFKELSAVTLIESAYSAEQIAEAQLIFACTDQPAVNQQIVDDAKAHQWVNDCSERQHSDFYNMATITAQDYLIAISTYGKKPAAAKALKAKLNELLKHQ
ncbi:bifunctional precorrin-2 dehydrogenase/sirohydrochlorin ferrochelatase [Erwinia sp. CPCC 100877]|nr:bifunctional precorrin-2 dehydrogenase/sirohydrochlorin ferrochelatase [Erwinia sp. CPCC 100877]